MRVHQVVSDAFQAAGIAKPDHVGAVHVLRHSGAIARLEQTGNPKALQDHLRHADARMTLRCHKDSSARRSKRFNRRSISGRETHPFGAGINVVAVRNLFSPRPLLVHPAVDGSGVGGRWK